MKPIKMLGLAALAALMAMAFFGASSAMAESTTLCTAMEEPCEILHQIGHVHEETLSGSPAVLLSSAGNVLCTALYLGDVLATATDIHNGEERNLYLGAPIVIHGSFTYTNCVRHKVFGGTEPCTVTQTSETALISILKEGHELAKVTGSATVNVHCGSIINCTYNGEGLEGHALGPLLSTETNGQVTLSNQTTHIVEGSFCPETGKLDITTTPAPSLTGVTPVYISK